MKHSSLLPSDKRAVPGTPRSNRSIVIWSTGTCMLLLALLFTLTNYTLYATLNYPTFLLGQAPATNSLRLPGTFLAPLGFLGLAESSMLLLILSRRLASSLEERRRRRIIMLGTIAGSFWIMGSGLGLVLLLLWSTSITTAAAPLAWLLFLLTEIGAPLVLALWTLNVAWHSQTHRVLGSVGAIGLFLVCLRSLIWGLNALLPVTSGFYSMAGILNLLAVVGSSLWLVWLGVASFQIHSRGKKESSWGQPLSTSTPNPSQRRNFLRLGVKVGMGVAGSAFVLARTGLITANAPVIDSDGVPAEPSLMGTLLYLMAVIFQRLNSTSDATPKRPQTPATPSLLPGFSLEHVNAAGVPALLICAPGATKSRALLYIHGGAFRLPAIEAHYPFVAQLSQEIGACVLMPNYRLAPENPFPAALQDCVAAYRWLRSQGIAASRLAIAGDSSGGNLTLATALSLREQGEALPAALVALSPALDLTTTGADPILGVNGLKNAYAAYTNNGAIDAHQPLVSPLYAEVHRLPPTFLLVGTQEVLRRDSLRMADKLRKAEVEVKLEIWPGMWHVWPISYFGDVFPEAPLTRKHMAKFIRQRLQ